MIISSEHRDLLEQFNAANDFEGATIKALSEYMSTPNADRNIVNRLTKAFEDAHEAKMQLWDKLKSVSMTP